jgi:hypothetical protein
MRLQFFEEADEEVDEHRAWYRKRSESAETGFLNELDHAIEQVTGSPNQWPRYLSGTRRYTFPKYPFALRPTQSAVSKRQRLCRTPHAAAPRKARRMAA